MTEKRDRSSMLDYRSPDTSGASGPGLKAFLEEHQTAALILGAALIILATFVAYIPAINGGFVWDDDQYVVNNMLLTSWDGLQRIWFDIFHVMDYVLPQYYPMTHTSFWIEYRLWGLNPMGFHTVNVVLHTINAMLVWLLLRKLCVPGAWLAAVIFALHPINVESVAWIAERKNVLSLMFFLSSLYAYLRYAGVIAGPPKVAKLAAPVKPVNPDDEAPPQPIEWFKLPDDPQRLLGLAVVLFLFALFSKTVTYSLPAVAGLIIFWKRGGKLTARDVIPLIPMLAVGIGMALLTSYMEKYIVGVAIRPQPWIYANGPLGQFGARCIIAGGVFWFYLSKLLVPLNLAFNYPRWPVDAGSIVQYIFPAMAALVIAAVIIVRKKIGGWEPVIAVLIFTGTLIPAMGFFDVWPMQYGFAADHFVYLPAIALIALLCAVVVRYVPTEAVAGIAGALIVGMVWLSFGQASTFKDDETLWFSTWKTSGKTSWMAANNYGAAVIDRDLTAAEQWFNTAIQLKPDYSDARLNLVHVAVRRAEAIQELKSRAAAATRASTNPSATTQLALPTTQTSEEFLAQAIDICNELLRIDPAYYRGHYFLGTLLDKTDKPEQAKVEFQKALSIYPRHLPSQLALGSLALKQGNTEAAIAYFQEAALTHLESSEAHSLLGRALLLYGKPQEGLSEWEMAMRLDPTNWQLPLEYGARMADSGKYAAAAEYFKRAAKINPRAPQIYVAWGTVAARADYAPEARTMFNKALEIDPTSKSARDALEALNSGRLQPTTRRATTTRSSTSASGV